MHELSATSNLIQMVVAECAKRKIVHPKKIVVDLGSFTSYSMDSLLFYFDILKRDEPLIQKTRLSIHKIPGKILCNSCKKKSTIQDACMIFCPKCHSTDISIQQGKEFILKKIET
jgi:hydrogenase nickel insertion protein HypA